jgi:hypothetical protein
MSIKIISIILLLNFNILFSANAQDEENKNQGQYLDWSVFSNVKNDKIICYMMAIPIKKIRTTPNRGEPHFTITKTKGNLSEISIANGYYYKKNTEAALSFGLSKFNLITYKTKAWTYGVNDDIEIIKALKIHDNFTVTATSNQNISTQDEYSLIGFNKAYEKLITICP